METSAREPIVNIPLAYLDLCSAHVCTRHDAISDERAFSNMMNYGLSLNEQEKKLISSFAVFQENKVLTCSIQGRRLGTSKKNQNTCGDGDGVNTYGDGNCNNDGGSM